MRAFSGVNIPLMPSDGCARIKYLSWFTMIWRCLLTTIPAARDMAGFVNLMMDSLDVKNTTTMVILRTSCCSFKNSSRVLSLVLVFVLPLLCDIISSILWLQQRFLAHALRNTGVIMMNLEKDEGSHRRKLHHNELHVRETWSCEKENTRNE